MLKNIMNCAMPTRTKIAYAANYYYSIAYIKITGTDKFFYRDYSLVHKLLVCLY